MLSAGTTTDRVKEQKLSQDQWALAVPDVLLPVEEVWPVSEGLVALDEAPNDGSSPEIPPVQRLRPDYGREGAPCFKPAASATSHAINDEGASFA